MRKLNMKRVLLILTVASLLIFATQPFAASAQVFVGAASEDGGIAAAHAHTNIFGWSSASAASIGNGTAGALAFTPVSAAGAAVATNGPAAAYAQGMGTPFFSTANVWTATLPGGYAQGAAFAYP